MRQELLAIPANEASWADLSTVFGDRGEAHGCQCQRLVTVGREFWTTPVAAKEAALRDESACGDPSSPTTRGLVGFLDGEPVAWSAVEPRAAYRRLLNSRIPWAGRHEDRTDDGVWAVTCFVVRAGFRRQGIARDMVAPAVEFARARGATAVEGYPMLTAPGHDVPWGEMSVGSLAMFTTAGFTQLTHPTTRRVVVRLDF